MPRKKIAKTDTGPKHRTARIAFANRFAIRTSGSWKTHLQAVGDLKEFTFYPKELKPKHIRLRAYWTHMKDSKRLKPAFVRSKKWFSRDEWKKTKKFRVLSFTNSEGGICAVGVTEPWNSPEFVKLVRNASSIMRPLRFSSTARKSYTRRKRMLLSRSLAFQAWRASRSGAKHSPPTWGPRGPYGQNPRSVNSKYV